jgi:hypothetical protein
MRGSVIVISMSKTYITNDKRGRKCNTCLGVSLNIIFTYFWIKTCLKRQEDKDKYISMKIQTEWNEPFE